MLPFRRRTFQTNIVTPLRGGLAPVIERTYATYLLVIGMMLISLGAIKLSASNYQSVVDRYGLTAAGWSWTDLESYGQLVSYAFLHGDSLHFLVNTLILLLAGNVIERRIGLRWTVAVFFAGMLASGLIHILGFPGEPRPLIGASGAVSALLGAASLVAGDFGFRLRIPAARRWIALTLRRVLLIWLGMQFWGLARAMVPGSETPGVAYWSHLAGFATGLAIAGLFILVATARRGAGAHSDLAPGYSGAGD